MRRWHLIIDVALCEDCNACLLSCKDEHHGNAFAGYAASQPKHGHRWIDITRKERGRGSLMDVAYLPKPCQHCASAPCVQASQGGAVRRREDGIVLLDPEKARGQRQLVASCPYGAIGWNEEAQAPQKCTMCAHLLDQGWKEPRCVQSCPTGALRAIKVDDAEWAELMRSKELRELAPGSQTRPSVLYRNLDRFTKAFIAGSVSCVRDGLNECAEGVSVTLRQKGREVGSAVTDNYGDFKFDGLEEGSDGYSLSFEAPRLRPATVAVPPLTGSVCLDEIVLA